MAKKSIGDLHATVTADAVQFVSEFKRADNEAKRSAASIKKTLAQQFGDEIGKTGKKFALGFLGAAALGAVIGEVKSVSAEINNIPAVPQDTIDSINRMNYEFSLTRRQIDSLAAVALGLFADLGTRIGIELGRLVYGSEAADAALKGLNDEAARFARLNFDKEIAQLSYEFERLKNANLGSSTDALEKEGEVLRKLTTSGVLDLSKYTNAKLQALQEEIGLRGGVTPGIQQAAAIQAKKNEIAVQQELNKETAKYTAIVTAGIELADQDRMSLLSTNEQLDILKTRLEFVRKEREANAKNVIGGASSVDDLKALGESEKLIADLQHRIFQLTHSARTAAQEIRDSFAGAFDSLGAEIADFAIDGEFQLSNFTDVVSKEVISTFAKLSLINPLLNGLFGQTQGWQKRPAFFADGGRPPIGKTSIIGEEGPELFVPDTAGTIIPNHALAGVGAAGGGGSTIINADLRGASVDAVMRLEAYVRSIDGTLERRAIGAVANERKRGGGMGRVLGA
ncbi:hypothetical protein CMV30_19000 [Nibricoccus aquaticus]|uniref:Bacteriophage tail tape measure C-terminal domain-containing protein n=1 Tax=Nibricoccus aquaticus TaxID=2576891 RepID=A0A290QHT5_9BACT|nr:hypothetical protein [Nibricoccus aquaticus]ATC65866.1 hypothetical protein CMV30_19000 [Nibricoccus aquaticus]